MYTCPYIYVYIYIYIYIYIYTQGQPQLGLPTCLYTGMHNSNGSKKQGEQNHAAWLRANEGGRGQM